MIDVTNEPSKEIVGVDKFFQDNTNVGLETVRSEDLPVPRLSLVQRTSTKTNLKDGTPARPGTYFYSATKESTPTFECTLLSAKLTDLPTFNDKRVMEKVWVFLGAREGDWKPFIFSCRGASSGAAKNFIGNVKANGKFPMFSYKVKLSSKAAEASIEGRSVGYFVAVFDDAGIRDNLSDLTMLRELAMKYGVEADKTVQGWDEEGTSAEIPEVDVKAKEDIDPSDLPF